MGLPLNGEVRLDEVMAWAQEQAQFLSPTQHHVLLYLCINAWRTPHNPEQQQTGGVLSGRTRLRKIRMGTGLSERAIRNALDGLQDAGYILAKHQPGNGASEIHVFWFEGADAFREEFRAGVRDLPKMLQRPKKTNERNVAPAEGNVVQFPLRHEVPQ